MVKMVNENVVRSFYRRLNHELYGSTELVAIDHRTRAIARVRLVDNEDDFLSFCLSHNTACNVYAGRNPRPGEVRTVGSRARDSDIKWLTAISLDIDPVRPKGMPAKHEQHQAALAFALNLQWDVGGCVDDSGNGAYLWIVFKTPINMSEVNPARLKSQFGQWHADIRKQYRPESYGLRIDGCYDFSRLKRVIGTFNHGAVGRMSRIVRGEDPDDRVRDRILTINPRNIPQYKAMNHLQCATSNGSLPPQFVRLLKWDREIKHLWTTPHLYDCSGHDWALGMKCLEAGIADPHDLASILANNPHGKFRRDSRWAYLQSTTRKLRSL